MNALANVTAQLSLFISLFKTNFMTAALLVALLWLVHVVNIVAQYRLNSWGIYPRTFIGLRGIFFAPFLHGDVNHLFLNSIPLLVLMDLILTSGMRHFLYVSLIIIVFSGVAVWLLGRKALHIGASALIMGYLGYLFAYAYWHPSIMGLILAVVCFYYFGSLLLNLFHTGKNISWEGHAFGFISGLLAAYLST